MQLNAAQFSSARFNAAQYSSLQVEVDFDHYKQSNEYAYVFDSVSSTKKL